MALPFRSCSTQALHPVNQGYSSVLAIKENLIVMCDPKLLQTQRKDGLLRRPSVTPEL